jgi:hypothetical protein
MKANKKQSLQTLQSASPPLSLTLVLLRKLLLTPQETDIGFDASKQPTEDDAMQKNEFILI